MELLILDKNFEEIGTLDTFNSFQWTRKYYDTGDFQLQCDIAYFNMFVEGAFLFRKDYELALIEEINYTHSDNAEYSLSVKGRFISVILNDRVVKKKQTLTGTHEDIAYQLLEENFVNPTDTLRRIDSLLLLDKKQLGEETSLELNNTSIGKKLDEFLKEKELSQRIQYDYLTNTLQYDVWKGKDRTEEQTMNSWAVFSDDYENVVDIEYSYDNSDHKNFAYIIGKNDMVVEVNQVLGNERRIEIVTTSSEEEVASLTEKGRQELDKNKNVDVIDCSIMSSENMLYLRDYDLGDLCTIKIRTLDKMTNLRITEVKEVYENGEVTITPKFGDDYMTIIKFIEREAQK